MDFRADHKEQGKRSSLLDYVIPGDLVDALKSCKTTLQTLTLSFFPSVYRTGVRILDDGCFTGSLKDFSQLRHLPVDMCALLGLVSIITDEQAEWPSEHRLVGAPDS